MQESIALACNSPHWEPVCYLHRVAYDETPALLKVHYGEAGQADSELEVTKVFAVESSWSALFQRRAGDGFVGGADAPPSEFLLMRGFLSPAVRCSNQATAVSILNILRSCTSVCMQPRVKFPWGVRLVETDGNAANNKAECLLQEAVASSSVEGSKDDPQVSGMQTLHVLCSAHKIHRGILRGWSMNQRITSGITKVCLVLSSAGAARKVKVALAKVASQKLMVLESRELSEEAMKYRQHLCDLFLPTSSPAPQEGNFLGGVATHPQR